jgi:pyruvate/2-oxoglutarate dehydrogenase complex dihydrolipoamide acyltransferase (E2) component
MKIIMPQIGMTMVEGLIVKWEKRDGESVKEGETIFLVETEKLTNEIEATVSGTLKIIVPEGESVPCGTEIAEIMEG